MPAHWITEIFKEFRRFYLHRFTSAIEGDEAGSVNTWARKLAGLTGDEILRGLDNLPPGWPPTAGEFLQLCQGRGQNEHGLNYIPPCLSPYRITDRSRLLSSDERDEERKTVRLHIAALLEACQ